METAIDREQQMAIEQEFADRLRVATGQERAELYGPMYDRIYEISLKRCGPEAADQRFGCKPEMVGMITRLSKPGDTVLEIGCGCGYLTLELAKQGRTVIGVDVSHVAIAKAREHAEKLSGNRPLFQPVSGMTLPFASDSFDLVFSVEMLEHIHEDDVPRHLREVFRVLKPEGRAFIETPNELIELAPHDASAESVAAYDDNPIHLKEWTYEQLIPVMEASGFRDLQSYYQRRELPICVAVPARMKLRIEQALKKLPRGHLRRFLLFQTRTGSCTMVGRKPAAV